jgi:hypothetical protein
MQLLSQTFRAGAEVNPHAIVQNRPTSEATAEAAGRLPRREQWCGILDDS